MLRPAPTSIALSQDDIAGVEKQMDMYLGLLKQGFKRADIMRYFKEHQATSQTSAPPQEDLRALSAVELALLRPEIPVGHVSPSPSGAAKEEAGNDASEGAEEKDSPLLAASSPTEDTEIMRSHAPRQSSLLRFGQNASPIRSEEDADTGIFNPPVRTYRPRTDTYSYNQSELSESDFLGEPSDESTSSIITVDRHSPMRPEAKAFIPRSLQPESERPQNSSPLPHGRSPLVLEGESDERLPASVDQDLTPTPVFRTPDDDNDDSVALPSVLTPELPHRALPYNLRSRTKASGTHALGIAARTPARPPGSQLDGAHVFSVYNDTLPAASQPQTSADLARQPLVTERNAAYTAPVGALGSPVRRHRGSREDVDEGIASPTARAMLNQSRRTRELERRVRIAGRLQQERSTTGLHVDEQQVTQQEELSLAALSLGDTESEENAPVPATTTGSEVWRDDLEDDRVGLENWVHEEAAMDEGGNPRVVSGNARRFWPL